MKKVKLFEQYINESAIDLLADEIEDAEAFDAVSDGQSVQARSTKKTWDDVFQF